MGIDHRAQIVTARNPKRSYRVRLACVPCAAGFSQNEPHFDLDTHSTHLPPLPEASPSVVDWGQGYILGLALCFDESKGCVTDGSCYAELAQTILDEIVEGFSGARARFYRRPAMRPVCVRQSRKCILCWWMVAAFFTPSLQRKMMENQYSSVRHCCFTVRRIKNPRVRPLPLQQT